MKTKIIVDSTVDLMPEEKNKVAIVPLTVRFGEKEYLDGIQIDHKTFYEKLTESDVLPTTSQAIPDAFLKEYEKAKESGEDAVVITISSKLSGTYQSAVMAKEGFDNIYVVDSGTGSVGCGILTEMALKLRDEGLNAKEIYEIISKEKEKIVIVALADTLEYLKRGGRISKTVAFAGTLLNIKPVLSVIDGVVRLIGKARGLKMGNNLLVTSIEKAGGIDFKKPLLLGYTGTSDDLLLKYIEDSRYIWENEVDSLRYTTIGSVIGTHLGPGGIVVAFFKN